MDNAAQNDPAEKVRQVGDSLHRIAKGLCPQLVDHQRKDHAGRKTKNQLIQADQQRIPHGLPEHHAAEQHLKVLPADPRTACNALPNGKILERQLDAIHGEIMKNQKKQQHRKQQQISPAFLIHALPQPLRGGFRPDLTHQKSPPFQIVCSVTAPVLPHECAPAALPHPRR